MIILLYTLLNSINILLQLYLVQCYHLTIGFHTTPEALFIMIYYKLII